jgi:hypothetical protein
MLEVATGWLWPRAWFVSIFKSICERPCPSTAISSQHWTMQCLRWKSEGHKLALICFVYWHCYILDSSRIRFIVWCTSPETLVQSIRSHAALLGTRCSLFRYITERRLVLSYRRCGITYWSHIQGSVSARRMPGAGRCAVILRMVREVMLVTSSDRAFLPSSLRCGLDQKKVVPQIGHDSSLSHFYKEFLI